MDSSDSGRLAKIEARLERLEEVMVGATLEVEEVVIYNKAGDPVVVLSATDDGHGTITVYNAEKKACVTFMASSDGGLASIQTGQGQRVILIGGSPLGGFLQAKNGKGEEIVRLGPDDHGEGMVAAMRGERRSVALQARSWGGRVITYALDGDHAVCVLETVDNTKGRLCIAGPGGEVKASWPPESDGQ